MEKLVFHPDKTVKILTATTAYNEKELLMQLSEDDSQAFRVLLEQHHRFCYQVALDFLQDSARAEDIVQEVFLRVWLRRKRMPEVENFGGWLRTVTVNLVYYHISKLKKDKERAQDWWREMGLNAPVNPKPTAEETYFEKLLSEAVMKLTPRQQQTFNLIKKEGYSREEAAILLGVSPETVKTNLERSMKTIRTYCISKIDPSSALIIFGIIFKQYF
ncbi:MAG TPA: RNA polymerase sigma factor [Flavitalea sp.]|nr:RNA polymerase sigma factor [Flavitalea sp.]